MGSSCLRVFARERRPRQRQTQRELGIDATAEMQMPHRYQRMSRRFTSVRRGGLAVVHRALPVVIFAPKNVRVKEVERARASSLASAAGNEKDDKSFFGFSSDDVTWTWEE